MCYTLGMTLSNATPSAPSRTTAAATDALARLLATENIRVEHQPVPTAMFDTETRTLTLPIWRGMSQDLYDMLVGHEVGHALWTPSTEAVIMDAIARVRRAGAPNDGWAKSILNITEDARIERLIKERFPGLRRNFTVAYRELIQRDIFALAECGGDPNLKGFVDRFNLYHKCGAMGLMQVNFSAEEQALVQRGVLTETFEDVVRLSEDIVRYLAQHSSQQQQDQDQKSQNSAGAPGSGDGDGADASGAQQQGDAGQGNSPGRSSDRTDTGSQTGTGSAAQPGTDDSATPPQGRPAPGAGVGDDNGKGRSAADGAALGTAITTDTAMSRGLAGMTDTKAGGYYFQYGDAPEWDWDRLMVRAEAVNALWRDAWAKAPAAPALLDSLYEVWKRENLPTVLNMVKRFEQRKAADDARRTLTAKTGRIDTSRLAYYKVSEDLFLSMTTTTNGKSHGLVMVIDWSGSMNGVLGSVVSQVLCLVEFCRRAGVPYEVYAFTDCVTGWGDFTPVCAEWQDPDGYYTVTRNPEGRVNPRGFRMVQFLRDGMTRAEHTDAVRGLVGVAAAQGYEPFMVEMGKRTGRPYQSNTRRGWYTNDVLYTLAPGWSVPAPLSLNGTPLNEALLASADIVERFRQRTGAQIVNLAVLTDGEASRRVTVRGGAKARPEFSHQNGYARQPITVLRWGSREFPFADLSRSVGRDAETESLIRYVRARTGARVYGFFLVPGPRYAKRLVESTLYANPAVMERAVAELDADGSCVVPHKAYDEYYVVAVAERTEDENFLDRMDATALTPRKIATTFKRGMASRNTSRTIMVRFTDCFATGKPSQHKVKA